MTVTLAQLEKWLRAPSEDEHLEFKEAKNDYDFEKLVGYCVALANEGGGHMVLGVSDKLDDAEATSRRYAKYVPFWA